MTPARLLERQSRRTSELANETLTTPSNNAAMIDCSASITAIYQMQSKVAAFPRKIRISNA
ncbi:hypothetical protein T10_4531 [Trichinella papuae]|uniref:Uncharacterized protein n=1 Tax=Trichinella papuae TaxID=268474 RepID=A0A0V1MHQ1_9BILA|nr:hypothetical protein T10_4531 [Trichinella papuae]